MTKCNSTKTIIIISEGDHSSINNREYGDQAEMLKIYLERKISLAKKSFNIQILKKAEQVDEYLKQNDAKAVIYLSYHHVENAQKNHLDHPELVVIIFTGLIPEKINGIHMVEKGEKDSFKTITDLVLT